MTRKELLLRAILIFYFNKQIKILFINYLKMTLTKEQEREFIEELQRELRHDIYDN